MEAEYKRRHDEIWPGLKILLKDAGISDYSIFLDEKSGELFAILNVNETQSLEALARLPLMKKWWDYMKDIMDTNPDHSPVSVPLKEVFHLP